MSNTLRPEGNNRTPDGREASALAALEELIHSREVQLASLKRILAHLRGSETSVISHPSKAIEGVSTTRPPRHLFARGGRWYVCKEVRGQRLRMSTGVRVGGERELQRALARQQQIEDAWDRAIDASWSPKEFVKNRAQVGQQSSV